MKAYFKLMCVILFVTAIAGCTTEVTLSVPDMMCEEGCAVKVREVLSKEPGVKQVRVDFPNRIATLDVDKSKFDVEQAVAVLVDHGFVHSQVKTANMQSITPAKNVATPAEAAPADVAPSTYTH